MEPESGSFTPPRSPSQVRFKFVVYLHLWFICFFFFFLLLLFLFGYVIEALKCVSFVRIIVLFVQSMDLSWW